MIMLRSVCCRGLFVETNHLILWKLGRRALSTSSLRWKANAESPNIADGKDLTFQDMYKIPTLEQHTPCTGTIKGKIPSWLNGNLYRNGPAKFEVGDTKYNHFFDGLAMIHHFKLDNGIVTYRNRFIESDTYKKNMAANRIVVSEFGTVAFPDPCQNIFQRFFSRFTKAEISDNTLVNVYPISDELYACTESRYLRQIDPETLASPTKADLGDIAVLHTATAHPHFENDGTVYNIGLAQEGREVNYAIIKIPPSDQVKEGKKEPFSKAKVVARLPVTGKFFPKYMHSFAITENYYVVAEQPLSMNVIKLITAKIFNRPYSNCFSWNDKETTKFRVIDRKTGEELKSFQYVTNKLFTFHHANAYEENDHLIVDLSGYDDASVMFGFEMKNKGENIKNIPGARGRRYVLPLKIESKAEDGKNLVTLPNTKATAVKKGAEIFCSHELLAGKDVLFELPAINYKSYNGRKYRYLYGSAFGEGMSCNELIKIDCETREVLKWYEENTLPSEMAFVQRPGATDEDDGVLICSVLDWADIKDTKGYLLVLDAKTMTELGRACFDFHLGRDIHGMFQQL